MAKQKTQKEKDDFKERMLDMGPCSAPECNEPAEFRDIHNGAMVKVCRKHVTSSL